VHDPVIAVSASRDGIVFDLSFRVDLYRERIRFRLCALPAHVERVLRD
jgi:hypothetical protein